MNKNTTNEFSFILKPSQFGVGVFATHGIKKGTYLRLFGNETLDDKASKLEDELRVLKIEDVPEQFRGFCIDRKNELLCPQDFGHMEVGFYLNHSKTPNAIHKNYHWYALQDIKEGEEVLVDYNTLEEPEEAKDSYY